MDITVTVCDVCADRTRETTRFRVQVVGSDSEGDETDRCEEHGWELSGISKGIRAPKAPRTSGRRSSVSTMAEVEAAKRRAPRKQA